MAVGPVSGAKIPAVSETSPEARKASRTIVETMMSCSRSHTEGTPSTFPKVRETIGTVTPPATVLPTFSSCVRTRATAPLGGIVTDSPEVPIMVMAWGVRLISIVASIGWLGVRGESAGMSLRHGSHYPPNRPHRQPQRPGLFSFRSFNRT
jgi:hypothetical protein